MCSYSKLAELSAKKDRTHYGTHSAIDGDDKTHESIAQDTGADSQLPAETNSNDGRSDFPVRDSPSVSHPVGYVGDPVPCSFGRGNWVEICIGGILCDGETALLLTNFKAEFRDTSPGSRLTNCDRREVSGIRRRVLLVNVFRIRHDGWQYWMVT